jgi:DnaJ like chaperone protein
MSWFGKIIGGGVGFVFGGPLGALVGATLGHALLDERVRVEQGERGPLTGMEQRQAVFFTAVFAMLGKIAKADGRVCEQEIAAVRVFMLEQLRLPAAAQQFAIGIFNEAKENDTPFEEYARQFGQVFTGDAALRTMFYQVLFSVAMVDGVLHPAEEALLRAAPVHLGLHPDIFETVRRQFGHDLPHHYAVLGLESSASLAEVKKAYRRLAAEYHPDKVVSKGLPEDFARFAEQKFKEINEAYAVISKSNAR